MRKITINGLIALVYGFLPPCVAHGQGSVTFLSNLGQSSAGSAGVGSNSWIGAAFISGNNANGYLLNSVQLAMTDASGSPSGFTVMIYSGADILGAIRPGSSVGVLTGSASSAATGVYTYAPSSELALSPSSDYFIVMTAGTAVASGAYEWSLSGINSYSPTAGWAVFGGASSAVYSSSNGSTWNSLSMTFPQFAINATAAPEPGVVGIIFAGGLLFGLQKLVPGRKSVPRPKSRVQS